MRELLRQLLPSPVQRALVAAWLRIERYMPLAVRSACWNGLNLFGKPQLGYLETHLVDHCNLNCRRCSHFAPLSGPKFVDSEAFACDMSRLGELFSNIRVIRLMGGEPLLHPEVTRFMAVSRQCFPRARIYIVTNGLLLLRMTDAFWTACRVNRVAVDLTVYPPLQKEVADIRERCKKERVALRESPNSAFCVRMNLRGDSPPRAAFSRCRNLFFCPTLKGGKLFVCAPAAYVALFNARFGARVPQDQGISLQGSAVSGRSIIRALNRHVEMCRFCALKPEIVPWENGQPDMSDWDIHAVSR